MQHLSIRLPLDFVRWIDARAKASRVPRSIVIREVILQAMQADASAVR
jgi:predicted transcriptional regulator